MIELRHISKQYETKTTEVEAVRDVSLTIADGEIFGIIGLSGAGKSTLVRCINYLERPTSGEVLLNGQELGKLDAAGLRKARRSMSMIFQSFNLLSQRTALRNVCYPLEIIGMPRAQALAKARGLLELVGLADRAESYPSMLSGGQQQRVAIARALACDPKVLLCDEATSALDPNTTTAILELLKKINRELRVTIVIITHEMRVVQQICDRVAVLDAGQIREIGKVKDVFVAPKSEIAKKLILPKSEGVEQMKGRRIIRIVFDGQNAFEPVIANLALDTHAAVNILAADTKSIGGKYYGQMVLQLPDDEMAALRMQKYLRDRRISYEEVSGYAAE